ncbi:MAG: diadenylate cyclase, partial [Eubacterium sp.]|nr:diadenylate cyclase [Eubacterium sp.]
MMSHINDLLNKILSVFSTFSISDFLDIVVVAIVIYICIRIIRESRALQLVKGLIYLAVVYGIVNLLDMEASSFIFKSIFSNILIILVILFAPEMRKILEQVGHGATAKSLKTIIHPGVAIEIAEISDAIESVCKACSDMSDQKIGALICFENNTLLGDVIATGTEMHAKVTKELVENIFFPKSPLHDGAMVIRDGKIYAAGCILPLTKKTVSTALGTRHRAG